MSRCDLLRRHRNRGFRHWLRTCEGSLRNGRHRAAHILVCISNVRDGRAVIDDRGLVNIRDRRLAHGRVADVDLGYVRFAHVIRRHENLTRSKREPCHGHAARRWRIRLRPRMQRARERTRALLPSDPGSIPTGRQSRPSGRSGRARIPTEHHPPTSIPRDQPKPSAHRDTEPIPRQLWGTTHCRTLREAASRR